MQILEAFRALNALNEDVFSLDADGVKGLSDFKNNDDFEDDISIIDPEAETTEDLQDNYIGKVILDCCVCHSKLYKAKEEVTVDENGELANVGEECPYCFTPDGFKVIGEVAAFEDDGKSEEDEDEAEESEDEVKTESLKEGIFGIKTKKEKEAARKRQAEIDAYDKEQEDNARMAQEWRDWCAKSQKNGEERERRERAEREARAASRRSSSSSSRSSSSPSNTGKAGVYYSGGDYYSESMNEGIFGPSYKGKNILVYRGNGKDEPIAICDVKAGNYNLIDFREAHAEKNGADSKSDYATVSGNGDGVKKYKKALKSVPDISTTLPFWVKKYVEDRKEQRGQQLRNDEIQREREAKYRREEERKKYKSTTRNPDDDYTYVQGKGYGTYQYRTREGLSPDAMNESIDDLSMTANDTHIEIGEDEAGKVTVTMEPVTADGGEMIAPVSDETEAELLGTEEEAPVEGGESEEEAVDVDVDEVDEESVNELGESYLRKVYENVNNFKTTAVRQKGNSLIVEGKIRFNSGKTRKTSFMFEALDATRSGKVRFVGSNKNLTEGKKAFMLTGKMKGNKLIAESLNYNYKHKDADGKVSRVYGTERTSRR